jgi:glycine hydroxymethyltransferase
MLGSRSQPGRTSEPNPFDAGFDIVTTTTHKTLRGPRAGMVLCRKEFADAIDRSVFPAPRRPIQHDPAIAITLKSQERVGGATEVRNARALAAAIEGGATLATRHRQPLISRHGESRHRRPRYGAHARPCTTTNKQDPDDPKPAATERHPPGLAPATTRA